MVETKRSYLVTGGSGFYGSILKRRLLADGHQVINLDIHPDPDRHSNLRSLQVDIRNERAAEEAFAAQKLDGVFHVAAMLAHASPDPQLLWTSNVRGTEVIAQATKRHGIRNLVFTSTNCLWGNPLGRPVCEDDPANPVELYGKSKWEGEKVLERFRDDFNTVAIRCPTIVDAGRLGLLGILFEFIDEGRQIWTVGGGRNRYQFICAEDLNNALLRAMDYDRSDVFHVGSDNVKSLREIYSYVIQRAGSSSQIRSLPRGPALLGMKIGHKLKLSPLGPYHYKMIAEDFIFDTNKIKQALGWRPTVTNEEMLWRAFEFYSRNRTEIERRTEVSAHSQVAKMGAIRLLKWVS
jgi:UDP-glucose 4-epimerase